MLHPQTALFPSCRGGVIVTCKPRSLSRPVPPPPRSRNPRFWGRRTCHRPPSVRCHTSGWRPAPPGSSRDPPTTAAPSLWRTRSRWRGRRSLGPRISVRRPEQSRLVWTSLIFVKLFTKHTHTFILAENRFVILVFRLSILPFFLFLLGKMHFRSCFSSKNKQLNLKFTLKIKINWWRDISCFRSICPPNLAIFSEKLARNCKSNLVTENI